MIEITSGDIFQSKAQALVNTVNCVGVMGRGLALQFKKAFPENFTEYKAVCDKKELHIGMMFTHDTRNLTGEQRYIINFPTKRHWRAKSRIEDIQAGLAALVEEIKTKNINSIAIPPLGCGLGGLPWEMVRAEIENAFTALPETTVYLYEPKGSPAADQMTNKTKAPSMTKGRAALLRLMQQYINGLMAPSTTLLELQKLMYFMQESGEDLRLNFSKGIYGPYAENLRHVLNLIEGHFITGYGDGGDAPQKLIECRKDACADALTFLKKHEQTLSKVDRVGDLIAGFETPYGMEVLATVHWLVSKENATNVDEVFSGVQNWNARKAKMIQRRHVEIAYNALANKEWIQPEQPPI
ncbi:macro domain-containing protein [Desulfovibrio sp. JC022]|uniref:type II toxin-antitoxin system antitoxin DNA ADP-ribosyl glycohydrolase DarG n=1 Tax=Desulfovibrio sp. JC022 TaxID=2593642 RepID=UPI0013D11694|nr:macro domain-containing protein [Desulfovibrio sp. JC022]NDV24320.1 macro domain-containing protein [Desulfovibrio sp. JC022]